MGEESNDGLQGKKKASVLASYKISETQRSTVSRFSREKVAPYRFYSIPSSTAIRKHVNEFSVR